MLQRLQDRLRRPVAIALASAIVLIGLLWVFIGLDLARAFATAREVGRSETMAFAQVFEEHAVATIRQTDLLTRDIARQIAAHTEPVALDRLFEDHLESPLQSFIALAVYDAAGRLVRRSDRAADAAETIDRREDFLTLAARPEAGLHIGLPFRAGPAGRAVIPLSRPVRGPGGAFAGVVVAEFDPLYFSRFYDSVGLGPQSSIALARKDGALLARRVAPMDAEDVFGRSLAGAPAWPATRHAPFGHYEAASSIDGVEGIVAYRVNVDYPVVIVVGLPRSQVFAAAHTRASRELATGALATLLLAGGGLALMRLNSRGADEMRRREAAERQATRLGQIMQGLLHLPVLAYRTDPRGIFTEISGAALRRLGLGEQEAVGRSIFELWPDHAERIGSVLAGGSARFESSGTIAGRAVAFDHFLVFDQVVGCGAMGVGVDITERKEAESALRAAKEESDRAHAAKSRLLAAASHDLRQPLQAAMLFHHLLGRHCDAVGAGDIHARLGQAIAATQEMLTALLDVSRLDAGTMQPECRDVPVQAMLDRLAGEFGPLAAASGLEFRMVRSGLRVRSDPHLLERMLRNLLSNAVRYTPRGRVLLGCRRRGGRVAVQVWDTGIGIAAADLPSIFTEYYQAATEVQDEPRGLGLGLSIVNRLGRLLDHPVGVRSTEGRGSMFEVVVPVVPAAATAEADPAGRRDAA